MFKNGSKGQSKRDQDDHRITAEHLRRLNKDQDDYLEILSQLIETYEDAHVKPPRKVAGIKLVRFLLAENDMTGDDLAELLGVDRSVAYKILKGTRNLTAEHIRKLADRFLISADALIG